MKWKSFTLSLSILAGIAAAIWYTQNSNCTGYICETILNYKTLLTNSSKSTLPKLTLIVFVFVLFQVIYHIIFDNLLERLFSILSYSESYKGVRRLLKFIWWTLFALVALSILIGNLTALVTSIGLIGFGITFALQKPILNFVGWLTITLKGLYEEGDRIQVGTIKGDIREIQVMNTILESVLDETDSTGKVALSFPNELILTTEVKNFSKNENYIKDRLKISICYENDYHKAMNILYKIVLEHLKKNQESFIAQTRKEQRTLHKMLNQITAQLKRKKKEDPVSASDEAETELEEEFLPKIRMDLAGSSIDISVQYMTPYDEVRKNRTKINIAFLDAIAKERNISIAYPHMHLVGPKKG
jgi:small-conductance mechanosensitive channel